MSPALWFLHSLHLYPPGYDLKQLFIGAEGTLGVVTGVCILAAPAPRSTNNVILALPRFQNVLPLFVEVKKQLSEILSAFEFFDRRVYDLAIKHGQGRALSDEDVKGAECFVLVETSGGNREHDGEVVTPPCNWLSALTTKNVETHEPLGEFIGVRQTPRYYRRLVTIPVAVRVVVGHSGRIDGSGVKGRESIQV